MDVTTEPDTPAIDLGVTQEDSLLDDFRNITEEKRFDLMTKTRKLLSSKKNITPAPGDDDMSFLVASESRKATYHHVTINLHTGQISCDSKSCLPYKRSKICHHTLAVAVSKKIKPMFAIWHNRQKVDNGLDKILAFELPTGTGKKAHKRTERRVGTSEKTAQVTVLKSTEGITS